MISFEDSFFVAGHNGMVGSAVVRALKKNGYENLLLENRNSLDLSRNKDVEIWFKNNKPNVVIIAAAKVGGIYANNSYPTQFLLENLKIQNNIIENAWKSGSKRLLFLGSSCIYPKNCPQPIKEEYLMSGYLEETNEAYAIAKIAGIKLCQALRKQYQFDAISLMPTNLYGPGDNYNISNSHVLPAFIRKFYLAVSQGKKEVTCWGTGNPLREFLHVDDLGEACVHVLKKFNPNSEDSINFNNENLNFLNVGTGKDLKIKDLAEMVAKATGFEGEIKWDLSKPDGTPKKQLDITNIKKIGWEPKINLKEGIEMTLKLFIECYKKGEIRY